MYTQKYSIRGLVLLSLSLLSMVWLSVAQADVYFKVKNDTNANVIMDITSVEMVGDDEGINKVCPGGHYSHVHNKTNIHSQTSHEGDDSAHFQDQCDTIPYKYKGGSFGDNIDVKLVDDKTNKELADCTLSVYYNIGDEEVYGPFSGSSGSYMSDECEDLTNQVFHVVKRLGDDTAEVKITES